MGRGWTRIALSMAIFVAGCATYPVNPSLKQHNPAQGYRYENLTTTDPNKNSEETFIILTFSGGGTRAAALSYGVLEHLHKAPIAGGRKTLLDEVDVISSVSGGSFTAAYYGLFGEEKFFRDYKEGVLHRRIEHELLLRVLAPWNWPWLLSPYFGRSDLADEYYDRYIFEGRTYAQMPTKRPFIIINATDMSLGAQFSFIQDHFDRLCSDLSQVHVSRAVVASSAFPVAFTPITLNNYPKTTCGYTAPRWVASGLQDFAKVPSRYDRAKTWVSYEDAERRPYIHLNDGGLADNIGLRGPEVAITTSDSSWSLLNKVNNGVVKRLAVIIVDAKPQEATTLDDSARPPGVRSVLEAAATNPMENYSSDTIELLRDRLSEWDRAASNFTHRRENATSRCDDLAAQLYRGSPALAHCGQERRNECYTRFRETANDQPPHPNLYEIHVRLEATKDPALRAKLEQIPTTLQLPPEDVELLIRAAATLLDQSEEYQRLLRDLDKSSPRS